MDSNNEQTTPDTLDNNDHEGRLAAENAKRRIQAKQAAERADAAEAEAESLRQQIAELRLSQARQQVTAKHPELTSELIGKYAPEGVDADGLSDWAERALGLVVALRGEKPVDGSAMSDAEIELADTKLELARQKAVGEYEHVTDEVLDALCAADTPEGVAEWAAEFERLAGGEKPVERKPVPHDNPNSPSAKRLVNKSRQPSGSSSSKPRNGGLQNVAQKLANR